MCWQLASRYISDVPPGEGKLNISWFIGLEMINVYSYRMDDYLAS